MPVVKPIGSASTVSPQSSKSSDYDHDDTASEHLTDSSRDIDSPHKSRKHIPKKMSDRDATDYRVISLDDRPEPGRLDEFVPEVERVRSSDEGNNFLGFSIEKINFSNFQSSSLQ